MFFYNLLAKYRAGFKSKRGFSIDVILNILASLIITGTMQIIVYPYLAWRFSSVTYGLILTTMGIANTLNGTFGNALNNVRLLLDSDYKGENKCGDFNPMAWTSALLSSLLCILVFSFIMKLNRWNLFLIIVFVVLGTLNAYYCVYYRIHLNFKKILLQKTVGAAGFLVGILLVSFLDVWTLPFVLSELVQMVMLLFTTDLYKEPFVITDRFARTTVKYLILVITTLSGNLINYLDRLILYPLLGGEGVSTYSVASFFGKSLGLVMTPIAGVLLGYYSQAEFRMTPKRFWSINGTTLFIGFFFGLISVILSPIITNLLYPGIFGSAEQFLFLANMAAIVSIVCNMTQSAVLRFAPTWIQLIKEAAYGTIYIVLGLVLLRTYGLAGFCFSAICANIIKLMVLYVLGGVYIGKHRMVGLDNNGI